MHALANGITSFFIDRGLLDEEHRPWYVYALESKLGQGATVLFTLAAGWLQGRPLQPAGRGLARPYRLAVPDHFGGVSIAGQFCRGLVRRAPALALDGGIAGGFGFGDMAAGPRRAPQPAPDPCRACGKPAAGAPAAGTGSHCRCAAANAVPIQARGPVRRGWCSVGRCGRAGPNNTAGGNGTCKTLRKKRIWRRPTGCARSDGQRWRSGPQIVMESVFSPSTLRAPNTKRCRHRPAKKHAFKTAEREIA